MAMNIREETNKIWLFNDSQGAVEAALADFARRIAQNQIANAIVFCNDNGEKEAANKLWNCPLIEIISE